MQRFLAAIFLLTAGCAPVLSTVEIADAPCAPELASSRSAPATGSETDWVSRPSAAEFDRPADCVSAARRLREADREAGWALIRACVARGHFTALRELLDGAWDDDLRNRPEAPALLTQIIAMRGGLVDGDVRLLHERRVPLFTLAEATARPDYFRGRFVVVRARVEPTRTGSGLIRLAEQSLRADSWDIDMTPTSHVQSRSQGHSATSRGEAEADAQARAAGAAAPLPGVGAAALSGWDAAHAESRHVTIKRPYNYEFETGREAVARLLVDDPFLDPDGSFVLLARFDGSHDSGSSGSSEADLTVLDYQRPAALVMY